MSAVSHRKPPKRAGGPGANQSLIIQSPDELVSRGETGALRSHTVSATPHVNWDVSPDGQSFAMVRFNPATRIMVIQQLPALVARLQGGGAVGGGAHHD